MTKEQEIVLRKARKYRFAMLQYRETTQRFYKEQASHMEYMARKVKYHRALNEFLDTNPDWEQVIVEGTEQVFVPVSCAKQVKDFRES